MRPRTKKTQKQFQDALHSKKVVKVFVKVPESYTAMAEAAAIHLKMDVRQLYSKVLLDGINAVMETLEKHQDAKTSE